jgi:hypothetical protein
MLIPLAEFASRTRQDYNRALRRALRGDVPGATRLGGRWYVEDEPCAAERPPEIRAARRASPPEVRLLRRLAEGLARRPLAVLSGQQVAR